MNIPKDVYNYMTNFADDKTIVNMLSVDKKFNDPVFFEKIFNRKYPLLIEFKKDNQTLKDFYLSMIQYISKLEEEFGIPYIPTEGYNPKEFYNEFHNDENIYNRAVEYASRGGHIKIVKIMIEKGASDFNKGMYNAIYGGHMDIVKFLIEIEKGADEFNGAMRLAAVGGNIDIVKLMIEKGATDFNSGILGAAIGGNIDIVKLMIEKGATDFGMALKYAANQGHIEIVKLMIEKGVTEFSLAIVDAAYSGHIEIVKYLKNLKK